jgi:CubicO group peptidase (beta-lactamase class C family)
MSATSWGGGSNPSPAAGATTTLDDYARFLDLMLHDGVFQGRRLLSSASVAELERDQVVGYDTSHDYSVGITKIPTYGLGLWRDQVDASDAAFVLSGNGGKGFYPWIDYSRQVYGVVAVQDDRGAEQAVPASRVVVDAAIAALGPT